MAALMFKVCGVCGDKALGYNFSAVTCESCKAFFRRNALTTKQFSCPFNNDCEITVVKRRFCQKCRLDKCFAIGMRKEHIMTEEDKELKRKKIEQNKAKKLRMVNNSCDSVTSDSDTGSRNDKSESNDSNPVGNEAPLLEVRNDSVCQRHVNFRPVNNALIRDTLRIIDGAKNIESTTREPGELNFIESILCEAIKLEYESFTPLTSSVSDSRELNDAERAKLNELIVANRALSQPVDDDMLQFTEHSANMVRQNGVKDANPVLLDIINLTSIAIRRLIKMAKKISGFKHMCQEDQVALLKGGCTEMMILRGVMTYDTSRGSWKVPYRQEEAPLSQIKADILKETKGNIYHEHERFIKTFDQKWRTDENIIFIMCAITLFTPTRPRVVHPEGIKLEQNSYYYLLRRYLESIYGCGAKLTFLKLIQKISELHKLNGEVISVYLNVDSSHVEPLLTELFDLKPH